MTLGILCRSRRGCIGYLRSLVFLAAKTARPDARKKRSAAPAVFAAFSPVLTSGLVTSFTPGAFVVGAVVTEGSVVPDSDGSSVSFVAESTAGTVVSVVSELSEGVELSLGSLGVAESLGAEESLGSEGAEESDGSDGADESEGSLGVDGLF